MTGSLLGAFLTGGAVGCLSAGLLVAAFYDVLPDRTTRTPAAGAPLPQATGDGPTDHLPRVTVLDDARRGRATRKDNLA